MLEEEKEGEASNGMGLEDGEGSKDVSDQIESEDQLEDARRPEDQKEEEDKECKVRFILLRVAFDRSTK